MTIAELIEVLKTMPQDRIVCVMDDYGYLSTINEHNVIVEDTTRIYDRTDYKFKYARVVYFG